MSMVQMTIQTPSFIKESMVFQTERDMFSRYLSLMDEVDFRQELDLDDKLVQDILKNKERDVLYTNI